MTAPTKQLSGPCAKDIFPIIGKTSAELANASHAIQQATIRSGGVRVYRIPEGSQEPTVINEMTNGDIIVVGLDQKLPEDDNLQEVAVIIASPATVIQSFRFITKEDFKKKKSSYAIPPYITDFKTFKNGKMTEDRTFPSTRPVEFYGYLLEKISREVEHLLTTPDVENRPEKASDPAFIFQVMADFSTTNLGTVSFDGPVYEQAWSAEDLVRIALKDHESLKENDLEFTPSLIEEASETILDVFTAIAAGADKPDSLHPNEEAELLSTVYDLALMVYHHASMVFYGNLRSRLEAALQIEIRLSDTCMQEAIVRADRHYKAFLKAQTEVADWLVAEILSSTSTDTGSDDDDDDDDLFDDIPEETEESKTTVTMGGVPLDISMLGCPVDALLGGLTFVMDKNSKFTPNDFHPNLIATRDDLEMVLSEHFNNSFVVQPPDDRGDIKLWAMLDGSKRECSFAVKHKGITRGYDTFEQAVERMCELYFIPTNKPEDTEFEPLEELARKVAANQSGVPTDVAEAEKLFDDVKSVRTGEEEVTVPVYRILPEASGEIPTDGEPETIDAVPIWSVKTSEMLGWVPVSTLQDDAKPILDLMGIIRGFTSPSIEATTTPPEAVRRFFRDVPPAITPEELFSALREARLKFETLKKDGAVSPRIIGRAYLKLAQLTAWAGLPELPKLE